KVDGRRVVFTLPNGSLSMMRLSEVDLPASETATSDALRPPDPVDTAPAEPEALPEPVLVLTNDDIGQGAAPPAAPSAEGEAAAASASAGSGTPSASSDLRVVRWRRGEESDDGLELRGTVRNMSRNLAADVRVSATVRDAEGDVVGTANAFLDATSMVAGSSIGFRVLFDEVYDFIGEPEWTISAEMLEIGAQGSPTAQGSVGDAASPGGEDAEANEPGVGSVAAEPATVEAEGSGGG
ncbi:MAG: hypothetical protein AAGE94_03090, partial [Acidobacteriota bacterium]